MVDMTDIVVEVVVAVVMFVVVVVVMVVVVVAEIRYENIILFFFCAVKFVFKF